MDWDKLRHEWRREAPDLPMAAMDEVRTRDRRLWWKVRLRDRIETAVAVVVALFFGLVAVGDGARGDWVEAGFALLIAIWAAVLPFQLRRARRLAPEDDPTVPLIAFLRGQREAALAQARLLERVWLWYLLPPAVGIAGLTFAHDGFNRGSLHRLGITLLLYAGIAWLNRRTARTQFRSHAEALQHQIDALEAGGD